MPGAAGDDPAQGRASRRGACRIHRRLAPDLATYQQTMVMVSHHLEGSHCGGPRRRTTAASRTATSIVLRAGTARRQKYRFVSRHLLVRVTIVAKWVDRRVYFTTASRLRFTLKPSSSV